MKMKKKKHGKVFLCFVAITASMVSLGYLISKLCARKKAKCPCPSASFDAQKENPLPAEKDHEEAGSTGSASLSCDRDAETYRMDGCECDGVCHDSTAPDAGSDV